MERLVREFSRGLDRVAGIAMAATMVLAAVNVVMRFFEAPIQGAYEWVGFFTSLGIGLALAWCGAQDGHVAVTFLVDKLSSRLQGVVKLVVGLISAAFLGLAVWAIFVFGTSMLKNGEVSLTTKVPLYIFAYLIAFGFLVFCLVFLFRLREPLRKVVGK